MLERRNIVCFANDWDTEPTSKTHIMRILSERNRVLWVNSIGMRRPAASRRDLRRLLMKFRRGLRGCRKVHDNLYVYNPLVLPWPGIPGVQAFNTAILSAAIRHIARRLELTQPILWTFLPNVNGLIGRLGEEKVIYHCVDEYAAFANVARESLKRIERDIMGKADLVFTSSDQLCSERLQYNPRTFFVSHGVDVAHFSRAMDPATTVPTDMQRIKAPVIGFFGFIAEWIDLSLIRHIASARPDWSIVLVGRATRDLAVVDELPNVHVLGKRPYDTLPGYCRAFDVGIVPFENNELTLRANPIKLREYLAAGLPVVATDLPEVRKYRGLVRIAHDADGFVREIEAALREHDPASARQRMEVMKEESWEARVEQLSSIIESHLSVPSTASFQGQRER